MLLPESRQDLPHRLDNPGQLGVEADGDTDGNRPQGRDGKRRVDAQEGAPAALKQQRSRAGDRS